MLLKWAFTAPGPIHAQPSQVSSLSRRPLSSVPWPRPGPAWSMIPRGGAVRQDPDARAPRPSGLCRISRSPSCSACVRVLPADQECWRHFRDKALGRGLERDWFNGGLFAAAAPFPWSRRPFSISSLWRIWTGPPSIPPSPAPSSCAASDPAHARPSSAPQFTDPPTILRLINPVVLDPLRTQWAALKVVDPGPDRQGPCRQQSPAPKPRPTQAATGTVPGLPGAVA